MANAYLPHVHLIPEDEANRQVVLALLLELGINPLRYQIFQSSRGWSKALDAFSDNHEAGMRRYPARYVVLIIDFDGDQERLARAKERVPAELADRVFIFGTLSEPEDLKPSFGSLDDIGTALGRDIRDHTSIAWSHRLLEINQAELDRVRRLLCPQIQD